MRYTSDRISGPVMSDFYRVDGGVDGLFDGSLRVFEFLWVLLRRVSGDCRRGEEKVTSISSEVNEKSNLNDLKVLKGVM